ncbi:MAG TPA: SusD/RagB family nutrient-binding outer membrane lipoprotein [Bacteroidales bacterium]|nr:SusD/RagB family nutrient-binding outer membrane lipoprotein [Bacteroidales bacterium]
MNMIFKYKVLIAAFLLLFIAGCEKDFDKINKNPNAATEASTPALLTQAIRDFAYNDFDVWYAGRQSSLTCQHFAQRNYTSEDRYAFRAGTTDGFFRNNYIYMNNLQQIIKLNTDPATKERYASLYGDNNMQIAIAEIMKCWVFQLMTDYFGDVPYTQALDIAKYPQPVYDQQKYIYDELIAKLNEAQTMLINSTTDGFEIGDILFGGDLEKWIKFANSLRLRIALRASNVDPSYLTEAQDAINDGVMESNDDNAMCRFSSSGAPNEAPWYNGFYVQGRNDFTYTAQFMELIKGNNYMSFVNPFNGLRDPRYPVFTTFKTDKEGVPYGMSDVLTQKWWSTHGSTRVSLYSVNPIILDPTFPTTFLDYPTVCFMVSEVEGWDADWFEKGVRASLEKWGATDVGDAYITEVMARFNSATTEGKKEMVITQKYIHLLMQPHEAWAEYRRTGYPKSLVKPGQITAIIDGAEIIFTPSPGNESGSDVAARFKYPTSEYTLNKTNVEAAVKRMGEDSHKQRVWWDGGGLQ